MHPLDRLTRGLAWTAFLCFALHAASLVLWFVASNFQPRLLTRFTPTIREDTTFAFWASLACLAWLCLIEAGRWGRRMLAQGRVGRWRVAGALVVALVILGVVSAGLDFQVTQFRRWQTIKSGDSITGEGFIDSNPIPPPEAHRP